MNKALFIDRDGVINIDKRHVYRKEDFEFTAGIFDLCRKYSDAGYKLLIITNQAGIAKGIYTEDDFNSLMKWVVEEFNRRKITIDKVYYCPHHPDFTGSCRCRKPEAGMLLQAQKDFDLYLPTCVLIGDKESDIEAGRKAGIPEKNMLLLSGQPIDYLNDLPGLL